jgi:hypothetical protein
MSPLDIAAALYARCKGIQPAVDVAYPNKPFTPRAGQPYVRMSVIYGPPDNRIYGPFYREKGMFQAVLCYPLDAGEGAALERAAQVRSAFTRGLTLAAGDGHVLILDTAMIAPALIEGDRYCVPVRAHWCADVYTGAGS